MKKAFVRAQDEASYVFIEAETLMERKAGPAMATVPQSSERGLGGLQASRAHRELIAPLQ